MAAQFIVLFLFSISIMAMLVLYSIKLAHHFKYLRVKDKKKNGQFSDFYYRNFIDKKDSQRWKDAWLLFPLMYGIEVDDESDALNAIKKQIKKVNLAIYGVLIVALLVTVYAAKAFPEGIF